MNKKQIIDRLKFLGEELVICTTIKVEENDMGKVIGREGKIAAAIRTVMKALAAKEQKKVTVEFIG